MIVSEIIIIRVIFNILVIKSFSSRKLFRKSSTVCVIVSDFLAERYTDRMTRSTMSLVPDNEHGVVLEFTTSFFLYEYQKKTICGI